MKSYAPKLKEYVISKMEMILMDDELAKLKESLKKMKTKDILTKYKFTGNYVRENIDDLIATNTLRDFLEYQKCLYVGGIIMCKHVNDNIGEYASTLSHAKYLKKIFSKYHKQLVYEVILKRDDIDELFDTLSMDDKFEFLDTCYRKFTSIKYKKVLSRLLAKYNLALVETNSDKQCKVIKSKKSNICYLNFGKN